MYDDRDDPVARRLALLGKAVREQFHEMLADEGCTIPTWAVLRYAHERPGQSQVQLAGHIGVEGPTLARTLDKLAAEGLVERRRDEHDRRVVRVWLTPAGDRRWAALSHVAEKMDRRLTRYLGDDDIVALHAAFDAIHRALEDDDDRADANR